MVTIKILSLEEAPSVPGTQPVRKLAASSPENPASPAPDTLDFDNNDVFSEFSVVTSGAGIAAGTVTPPGSEFSSDEELPTPSGTICSECSAEGIDRTLLGSPYGSIGEPSVNSHDDISSVGSVGEFDEDNSDNTGFIVVQAHRESDVLECEENVLKGQKREKNACEVLDWLEEVASSQEAESTVRGEGQRRYQPPGIRNHDTRQQARPSIGNYQHSSDNG